MKRNLKEINSRPKKKKAKKKIESDEDSEESEGSQFSLRESSTSPVDLEMDEETDDRSINYNSVTPEKIKDNCYVLVKFEKKTSVVYYVGKVLSHFSNTEMKISYLRKKPGLSWSFFFPDVEDIHTLYISDVAMILPDPQLRNACTARMARLFNFAVNFTNYNVQ